jgi:hypothetical protein
MGHFKCTGTCVGVGMRPSWPVWGLCRNNVAKESNKCHGKGLYNQHTTSNAFGSQEYNAERDGCKQIRKAPAKQGVR